MRSMRARVRAGSRNASNTARASAVVFVGPVASAMLREGGVVALTVSVLGVAMAAMALALPMRGADAGATFATTAFLGSRVVMRARSP